MVKYSEVFKLKVVQDYLTGALGFTLITREYGISDKLIVRRWVRVYKEFVRNGLTVKKNKQFYFVQFNSIQIRCITLYETNQCFLSRHSDSV